jgi:type IV secretion system protein TrbL
MCPPTNVGCQITKGFGTVIANGFEAMTKAIGDAALQAMNGVATFWVKQPSPVLVTGADTSSPQSSNAVAFLQQNILEITGAVFLVAVLVAAMRTAWEHRAQPLQQLLKAMMIFVLVSAAGAATMQLLSEYSDYLSNQIITTVHPDEGTLGAAMGAMVLKGSVGVVTGDITSGLLTTFIGVFVIVGALIQVILMMIRSAMLIILAGTFPLAAAATNTEIGLNWFKKYCGWALGFLAYKPAAALIYAAAIKMNQTPAGQSGNAFVQTATGLMMLFLAIFALPALLRFMVPLTSAVAGGNSGSGTAVADPGGMATGALNIGRSGKFGGAGAGAGGGGAGAGASGAAAAGPVGAGVVAAGAAINGARKLAGGVAGAASHSAGEGGGGSTTPTTSVGPMSRASSSKSSSSKGASGSASPPPLPKLPSGGSGASGATPRTSTTRSTTSTPQPTGPSGAR